MGKRVVVFDSFHSFLVTTTGHGAPEGEKNVWWLIGKAARAAQLELSKVHQVVVFRLPDGIDAPPDDRMGAQEHRKGLG